jgi:hypothetical protein
MPITAGTTDYGYCWRYDHSDHEPGETLDMAVYVAEIVAGTEARKSGHTYYVTSVPKPAAICVLRFDNPEFAETAIKIILEITPKGDVLRPIRH